MKRICFILQVLLIIFTVSCSSLQSSNQPSDNNLVYLLPVPDKVFFYRDGTTVYEAKIPQSNTRRNVRTRVLRVTVPEIKDNSPLDVNFGIGRSGISWSIVLDMEVKSPTILECNLLASITISNEIDRSLEYILLQKPEIHLISSANVFLEGSDAVFNLGNLLLEKNKTTFIKLESGESNYRLVYRWNTANNDRPTAMLYCSNPFNSTISSVQGNLNSNGLNIRRFSSMRLIPQNQFDLLVGDQPLFTTFKSAVVNEHPNRPNLPYTHIVELSVTNQLETKVELEIIVPVTYGRDSRTQYRFINPPDERPGNNMIWKFELSPNDFARVDFDFDTDVRNNAFYSNFDHYSNGR